MRTITLKDKQGNFLYQGVNPEGYINGDGIPDEDFTPIDIEDIVVVTPLGEIGFGQYKLQATVDAAILSVEEVADDYHAKLAGTTNPKKAKRYEKNVELARAILNNTASGNVKAAMQKQLDADKRNDPDVFSEMDLESFCQWLVRLGDLADVAAPLIEAIRIDGKARLKQVTKASEIERVEQEVKDAFASLMQGAA